MQHRKQTENKGYKKECTRAIAWEEIREKGGERQIIVQDQSALLQNTEHGSNCW